MDPAPKRPGSVAFLVGLVLLVTAAALTAIFVPLAECPGLTKIDIFEDAASRVPGAPQDFVAAERKIRRELHLQSKRCNLCAGKGNVSLFTKWTVPP